MQDFLSGKKTYAAAALMLIYAAAGWATGLVSPDVALQTALQALAIIGLRLGIAKAE